MKNLGLLFCVCLGVLAIRGAHGVDYDDIARATSRATATNISTTTPTRAANTITQSQKYSATSTSRSGATNVRNATPVSTEPRTATKNVATRSTTNTVTTRMPGAPRGAIVTRTTQPAAASRAASKSRVASTMRRETTRNASNVRSARNVSRAATSNESGALITNYTHCREIYYECMDEFCANKDTNLRRCACSSRATEFEKIKKNMSEFEDKMLDFNQRLLLVNLDAEDVDAINQSTEGEDAFYGTKDKTKSKRALDEIAKKLNSTFDDDANGVSLAPISLSLNMDSAFDTVDSLKGTDATLKSGTALYNAAIPICRETALEVCTEDELSMALSGYTMLIEQDCNTVQKAYQAQVDAAHSKVFESSALLDMTRLDAYQTRNSDDILTCKRKMLDMLTNSTVCGAKLEKCLDMTGKYIDPTTGAAFLTQNLADLGSLIIRPDATQSWTSANGTGKFITYLKNKKQFLAPAMENCQSIADSVWDAFIEDALAQIKLAQDAKLEQIRQACTTLTSECLTSAYDSISEFDARALSIFGVSADQTANTMCANVRNSCTALMNSTGDNSWENGISEITTTKTYDSIITSCTQVGRNCITQSCRSISGNFDLCDDIEFSPNRHAILERKACWPAVLNCVAAAGDDAILAIMASLNKDATDNFYIELYGNRQPVYNICAADNHCGEGATPAECATCRIAERIWGNCEAAPADTIVTDNGTKQNKILSQENQPDATLLGWFAKNTNSLNNALSCINKRCISDTYRPGYLGPERNMCIPDTTSLTSDGLYCPTDNGIQMHISSNITNCCYNTPNGWGHVPMNENLCCETGNVVDGICMPQNVTAKSKLATDGNKRIMCIGANDFTPGNTTDDFPGGNQIRCNGTFIITEDGKYTEPVKTGTGIGGQSYTPKMVYYTAPTGDENPHAQTTNIMHDTNPNTNDAWYIHYE